MRSSTVEIRNRALSRAAPPGVAARGRPSHPLAFPQPLRSQEPVLDEPTRAGRRRPPKDERSPGAALLLQFSLGRRCEIDIAGHQRAAAMIFGCSPTEEDRARQATLRHGVAQPCEPDERFDEFRSPGMLLLRDRSSPSGCDTAGYPMRGPIEASWRRESAGFYCIARSRSRIRRPESVSSLSFQPPSGELPGRTAALASALSQIDQAR